VGEDKVLTFKSKVQTKQLNLNLSPMTKPNSMEFQSTLKNLLENYGYKNLSVIG